MPPDRPAPPSAPRRFRMEGEGTPAGGAIARALLEEGWEQGGDEVGLVVEARALPAPAPLLDPPGAVALAEALRALVELGAAGVSPGGLVLLVTAWAPPREAGAPPSGWTAALLALRRAWVEGAAREAAPLGVRVAGLAAPAAPRLPGFLRAAAPARGVPPEEVARAALWLAGSPAVTGRTVELG